MYYDYSKNIFNLKLYTYVETERPIEEVEDNETL